MSTELVKDIITVDKKSKKEELFLKELLFKNASKKDLDKISNNDLPKNSSFFTIFKFHKDNPVAFIDINEIDGNNYYCVILVDKNYRGLSLGTSLYLDSIRKIKEEYKIKSFSLISSIELDNTSSVKAAEKAGFNFRGFESKNMLLYVYNE